MRAGDPLRPWSTSDEAYLALNAGTTPMREMCRHLRRTNAAVRDHARQMRARGIDLPPLRCHVTRLVWCDHCAAWRTSVDSDGRCPVCRTRAQLERNIDTWHNETLFLSRQDRECMESVEVVRRGIGRPPRPSAPSVSGLSARERGRVEDEHAVAVERWEVECLRRDKAMVRSRTRRVREKTGRNPRKNNDNQ